MSWSDERTWDTIPWTTIPLFYPAQVTWEWLVDDAHPGSPDVRADTRGCMDCHGENSEAVLELAQASTGREQRGPVTAINRWLTIAAVLALLTSGTVVAMTTMPRKEP